MARLLLGRGDGMCQVLKSTYPLETTVPVFFSSLAHEWPRHQVSFQVTTTQQQAAFVAELVAHNARRISFRPRAETSGRGQLGRLDVLLPVYFVFMDGLLLVLLFLRITPHTRTTLERACNTQ